MSTVSLLNQQTPPSADSMFAWPDEVQKRFATQMVDLFHLALLLTGDFGRAQECIVLTIRECMSSGPIVHGSISVWIRDAVIRNGIRMVLGTQCNAISKPSRMNRTTPTGRRRRADRAAFGQSAGIVELPDFDRLVYVVCAVERYAASDCAVLMGKSRQEVRDAHCRATAQISNFERNLCRRSRRSSDSQRSPSAVEQIPFDCACGGLLD